MVLKGRLGRWMAGTVCVIGTLGVGVPFGIAQLAIDMNMGPIAPEDTGVERFTLPNGLRVILRQTDGCGYATIATLFHFGESSDPEGKVGMARLNSRVYVTAAAGEIASRSISEWANAYPPPEQINGVVGEDYIAMSTRFTADKLDGELMEVAARLSGVRPEVSDLERERASSLDAIRAMNQDVTPTVAYLWTRELLRPSPPNFRFGGIAEDVQSITLEDCRAHMKWFCPANATVIVVGAIEMDSTRALIENKLGVIPAGVKAAAPRVFEAPVLGARKDVTEPTTRPEFQDRTIVMLGYHPPAASSPMYAVFQVLIGYVYKEAMNFNAFPEEGRAVERLQVMYRTVEDNELVQVAGMVAKGQDPEKAIEELKAFVKFAAWNFGTNDPVDIETARGAFRWFGLADADIDVMCESQFPVAFGMGRLEQMGLQTGGALVRSFEDVTKDQLRECAELVFGEKKHVTVVVTGMKPEGEAAAPAGSATP